jgi:hypothetical protein
MERVAPKKKKKIGSERAPSEHVVRFSDGRKVSRGSREFFQEKTKKMPFTAKKDYLG